MPHFSKADLAKLNATNPLAARRLIAENMEQYARDGYIGDAPGTPATPPAVAPAATPPVAAAK